jgi:hypothetical protein
MRSVRSILVHGYQPLDPELTQVGATTLEVLAFHITRPALPNRRSSSFQLSAPLDFKLSISS